MTSMLKLFSWCLLFAALFSSIACASEAAIILKAPDAISLEDKDIWRSIPHEHSDKPSNLASLKQRYKDSSLVGASLLNHSGAYLARIPISFSPSQQKTWFVKINANFVDTGLAFWQQGQSETLSQIDFSQHNDNGIPRLMHTQAFELPAKGQDGVLWIYIDAKHYALPLTVSFLDSKRFFKQLFFTNTVTLFAIAVMLTLALIALTLFLKTRLSVTLACSGYIGLHGLGWAAASGLLDDILNIQYFNSTYLGMVLFPFAIAAASQYTKLLFNLNTRHHKSAKLFNGISAVCLALGLAMPFINFSTAFAISHVIAILWVPLSITTGWKMLSTKDFRAKYYLLGNLTYGLSLLYYVLSHSQFVTGQLHAELAVVSALAIDCFFILLSLAAWLQQKKQDYSRAYTQARIDPLTNLGNRYALSEALDRLDEYYLITFIDYDGVKVINDRLGHDQGDELLKYGAKLMATKLGNRGQVFRTGGDEFVWLTSVGDPKQISIDVDIIERLLQDCHRHLTQAWHNCGFSYGIAHSLECNNQSQCLALADQRMYQHKRTKKASQTNAKTIECNI